MDGHPGADTDLARDPHVAAVLLDDAVYHREAEAGAFAYRLGGEERLEHLAHGVLVHPPAAVLHGHPGELAGDQLGLVMPLERGGVDELAAKGDPDLGVGAG